MTPISEAREITRETTPTKPALSRKSTPRTTEEESPKSEVAKELTATKPSLSRPPTSAKPEMARKPTPKIADESKETSREHAGHTKQRSGEGGIVILEDEDGFPLNVDLRNSKSGENINGAINEVMTLLGTLKSYQRQLIGNTTDNGLAMSVKSAASKKSHVSKAASVTSNKSHSSIRSTKAVEARAELAESKKTEAELEETIKGKQDMERQKRQKDIRKSLAQMSDGMSTEQKIAREKARKAETAKQAAKEFAKEKKEMEERIGTKKLMAGGEREKERKAVIRRKQLEAIKQSCDAAGITDYSKFLDKKECEDLGLHYFHR